MESWTKIPLIAHLRILPGGEVRLLKTVCVECGATYFSSRVACASCGGRELDQQEAGTRGRLVSFTIVHRAAPAVPVPFVSSVVDLDGGGRVKANLVNVPLDPEVLAAIDRVAVIPMDCGCDEAGNRAVGFAFTPVLEDSDGRR